jgi:hypothetical protein
MHPSLGGLFQHDLVATRALVDSCVKRTFPSVPEQSITFSKFLKTISSPPNILNGPWGRWGTLASSGHLDQCM